MGSRESKKEALDKKLEKLRIVTNSTAVNKASIVVDASRYIEELKVKVEQLNQDVAALETTSSLSSTVKVKTLEKGFLIDVFSERNCPGMLRSILEAFDEVGLEVFDARVSCTDNFHLEAVSDQNEGLPESIDAQVVKQAVLQAIRNCSDDQD
ncbi:basic helix-loop-helix (bHLH) DNA-bindingsuperfamily protein [Striga asiatica]|uniref:Basic helix-loop-helix (BHLH) DNA-bindingsuperfamily protein n=1 Tax=Striga asiatica TaxID=4170 RepID=A0A5A7RDC6_STRAF|nr:basic helix-loop-helix (bHLH) DNA-bindingsuperfamily protein [Striga asiatica]